MAYKSNSTNKQSKSNTGDPAGNGISGGFNDANTNNLDQINDLEDRYTDGNGEPTMGTPGSHPNRNTNKPSIDKPRYS